MTRDKDIKIVPKNLKAILMSSFALMSIIPLLVVTFLFHQYDIFQLVTSQFFTLMIVFALISALLGFWLLSHLINSILQLSTQVKKIEKSGELLDVDPREQTEIGTIASSFNSMMSRLKQKVQELEKVNQQLKVISITDDLTGLYNFRSFKEFLTRELARSDRKGYSITLVMLDLDNFKNFNDKYGHSAGNEYLKQVATMLRNSVRRYDIIARYGGDEFVVILPETKLLEGEIVTRRLQKVFAESKIEMPNSQKENISASFGIATRDCTFKEKGNPDRLVEAADQALYRAKHKGKGFLEKHRMAS